MNILPCGPFQFYIFHSTFYIFHSPFPAGAGLQPVPCIFGYAPIVNRRERNIVFQAIAGQARNDTIFHHSPFTFYPSPFALHLSSPHPEPSPQERERFIFHSTFFILHSTFFIRPSPFTFHLSPFTLKNINIKETASIIKHCICINIFCLSDFIKVNIAFEMCVFGKKFAGANLNPRIRQTKRKDCH